VWRCRYGDGTPGMEETNRQLAAFMKTIEPTEPNAVDGSTNDGDLQTTPELLKRDHPALNALTQYMREAVQACARTLVGQECSTSPPKLEFVFWSWGAILREGNARDPHPSPISAASTMWPRRRRAPMRSPDGFAVRSVAIAYTIGASTAASLCRRRISNAIGQGDLRCSECGNRVLDRLLVALLDSHRSIQRLHLNRVAAHLAGGGFDSPQQCGGTGIAGQIQIGILHDGLRGSTTGGYVGQCCSYRDQRSYRHGRDRDAAAGRPVIRNLVWHRISPGESRVQD